jgi:CheY-like chemotaxis protein
MEPRETVILLAEDDAAVRNLVALMLSKEGYVVLAANDGQEALDICRQCKDSIHLLLTDVTMPRMAGVELAEQVQKKRSEIKILIMSGETADMVLNQKLTRRISAKALHAAHAAQMRAAAIRLRFQGRLLRVGSCRAETGTALTTEAMLLMSATS